MMPSGDPRIETCLEQICLLGCRRVREIIRQLEQHQEVEQAASLTPGQRDSLLRELKSIMAVYDRSGNCEI